MSFIEHRCLQCGRREVFQFEVPGYVCHHCDPSEACVLAEYERDRKRRQAEYDRLFSLRQAKRKAQMQE